MVNKVIKRETARVIQTFTNGFAQEVIRLDNGLNIYISYDRTEVELVTVDVEEMTPQAIVDTINSAPDEE